MPRIFNAREHDVVRYITRMFILHVFCIYMEVYKIVVIINTMGEPLGPTLLKMSAC